MGVPRIAAFVVLIKSCRLGVAHCDECYTCTIYGAAESQPICNLTGNLVPSVIALLICRGEVEAHCLNKIRKRNRKCGIENKRRDRREHRVYFHLYKSKYSTINIEFSYLNFKNFQPHVQNNVTNCVQHKQKTTQKTNK